MRFRMNWRRVGFDWNRVRAFLVTAEEGSMSAAARALGVAQSTVSRQVEALEDDLGVVLFDRIGKRLVPSPAGRELVAHGRRMAEAARDLSLSAEGRSEDADGLVTVSASEVFSAHLLAPLLAELHRRHPGVQVELLATDAEADLRRREADIALRNFRPEAPELVARRVATTTGGLYASSAYLDQLGRPVDAEALERASWIGFDPGGKSLIGYMAAMGLRLRPEQFVATCNNHLVGWELVRQGMGVGVMSDFIAARDPTVERAWAGFPEVPVPLWLVAHAELRTSRRIRRVYDFLAEGLGAAGG